MPSHPVVRSNGIRGPKGDAGSGGGGSGVPAGGTTGQILFKNSNTDGDAGWENPPTGGVSGDPSTATHAAPAKTTLADADEFGFWNSVGGVLGKITYASLKAQIAAYIATLTQVFTNKDLTSGTNTFPTFNQNTSGNAASATKLATARNIAGVPFDGTAAISLTAAGVGAVPTTRNVNGIPLSSDISIGFHQLANGTIEEDQLFPGMVVRAFCDDGITWKDASGVALTARPVSRTDVFVEYIDTTPAGSANVPSWGLVNRDTMDQANGTTGGGGGGGGGGGPTPLLTWYGTGLANAHVIAVADAGTGDSPAVASIGGTTAPTINATGGPTGGEAVNFAQAAAQVCNLHYLVNSPAVLAGRARFFLQTPASWYASSQGIFRFTDAADALLCGITLRGSGTPGALSINDNTGANVSGLGTTPTNTLTVSTWYRIELAFDQTAGTARLFVFNISGALIFDSGAGLTVAVGSGGTWAKAIWGPTVSSVTTAMKMAKLKIMSDPATAVGAA